MKNFQLSTLNFQFLFWLILLGGIGLRLYYMLAPETKLSADEAVYGVQAMNILGGEKSVFYYDQFYTGTLSAFISAFFFLIFGIGDLWVKMPIFLTSIGFLVTIYFLGKEIFQNRGAGLLVLGLVSFTSPFWMNWTTRAGTGYPETMFLGNMIFLLALKNLFSERSTNYQRWSFLGIGFLGGLGYWVQPTIVYYLLPVALLIFFWKPRIFITSLFPLGILGFITGSWPVIYFNLAHGGLNTASLYNDPFYVKEAMWNFFTIHLPIIFGLRKPFSTTDFFTPLTYTVGFIYFLAFVYLVIRRLPALLTTFSLGFAQYKPKLGISFSRVERIDIILLFLVCIFGVFSLSSPFNQVTEEPRYISPIYTGLPILITYLVMNVGKKSKFWAGLLYVVVLGSQLYGLSQVRVDSFTSQFDIQKIVQALRENKVNYVDAPAAFSYHIILESEGEIIARARDIPRFESRYPLYKELVNNAPLEEKGIFPAGPQPLVPCQEDLKKQMGPCKEIKVAGELYLYTWR